jgi:outer membrane protein assembly factor BamB
MGSRDGEDFVLALDGTTRKELWAARRRSFRQPARRPALTPTVDGNRVYALSANGRLVCLEVADGKLVWQKS